MVLGGIFGGGGGAKPSQPKPEPKPQSEQQKAETPREEPGARAETKTTEAPKAAPQPAKPVLEPAPTEKAVAKASITVDDGRRGAVAETLTAEARETPKAEARGGDEAAAAEAQARRIAEAAVESARNDVVLERVGPAEAPATELPTKTAAYGDESPYAAATSAEPDAARGGERAVDARV